jgi:hypothetical protein
MAGEQPLQESGRLLREAAERTAQTGTENAIPGIAPGIFDGVVQNPTFGGFVLGVLLTRGRAAGRFMAPIVIKITRILFRR